MIHMNITFFYCGKTFVIIRHLSDRKKLFLNASALTLTHRAILSSRKIRKHLPLSAKFFVVDKNYIVKINFYF